MNLVETHIIRRNTTGFKTLDDLCFKSKNLYNATLYYYRQYITAKNKEELKCPSFYYLDKRFNSTKQPDYKALPAGLRRRW